MIAILILVAMLVIGVVFVSYTFYVEKKRLDKDRRDAEQLMKEFSDSLKKEGQRNEN